MTDYRLNTERTVAVSNEYCWQPMETCPIAVKILLIGGGGIATIGQYNGRDEFWKGWAALPQVKKD